MRKKFHAIQYLLQLSWNTCKWHIGIVILDSLLVSVLAILWTVLPSWIVEAYQTQTYGRLYGNVGVLLIGSLSLRGFSVWCRNKIKIYNQEIKNEMDTRLDEKIMKMDYGQTEMPQIIDLKEKAIWTFENYGGITYFVQYIAGGCASLITVIWCIMILVPHVTFMVILMLCSYMILMILAGRYRRQCDDQYWNRVTPLNRKFLYLTWNVAHNYECGKDLRIYDAVPMVEGQMNTMRQQWRDVEFAYHKKLWKNDSITSVIRILVLIMVSLTIVYQNVSLSISVLCISTMIQFLSEIERFLSNTSNVFQMATYGEYVVDFLEIDVEEEEEKILYLQRTKEYTIEFRHVSFHYPGEEKLVLKDISFIWKKGNKTAIVGRNGAGKTTVVKLLCRLYEPTSGEILLNGKAIQDYSLSEYQNFLGVVFQDFKLFPFSIQDNIIMDQKLDHQWLEVLYIAYGVEAIIDPLPEKDQTLLDRKFNANGIELSGGQKQEVAITRAFYRQPELVILDEPSSALDAKTEEILYQRVMDQKQKAGLFFVSHRLSSCKFCDTILVMKQGQLVEQGSHETLMNQRGEYYQLFTTQAKLYATNQNEVI